MKLTLTKAQEKSLTKRFHNEDGIKLLVTDRINPLGNYNKSNCRLLERPINDMRQRSKARVIRWYGGKYIKAWEFDRSILGGAYGKLFSKEIRLMEVGKSKKKAFWNKHGNPPKKNTKSFKKVLGAK